MPGKVMHSKKEMPERHCCMFLLSLSISTPNCCLERRNRQFWVEKCPQILSLIGQIYMVNVGMSIIQSSESPNSMAIGYINILIHVCMYIIVYIYICIYIDTYMYIHI